MTDRPDFDVSGWMRLIGEVQQLGLDAARNVAESFSDIAESSIGSRVGSAPPMEAAASAWRSFVEGATDSDTQQQLVAAAQGMTNAMLDVMRAGWDFFSEAAATTNAVSWGTGSADLGSAAPGGSTSGSAYVHVGRQEVPDEVSMRVGPLTSGSGDSLPDDAVEMDPPSIESPEAGHSYEVTVRVTIPKDAAAGVYHGHLFARTVPASAVPIRVEVTGS